MPKSHTQFWKDKFDSNIKRDQMKTKKLRDAGWKVLTIWECETKEENKLTSSLKPLFDVRRKEE